ncbi:DUF3951 domain-containing protein [Metabacillus hrfriensis]|uniref:DUF3951 domain-containing protein n=1 Tax=Metabacillus hrfriensis TaxID=3048891 RepID=A0ACD4RC32_9BACI|nr:DUF3951 domain-containing protein [Metabacillus sp. CT-WN-B3]UOK57978.1 DUF3951 domain-containing protein [Bacillus sp. OVS6]USK28508.1 DUF3951 domain-containing protein [Bacillus sp. CMF21]WHZ57722.1 DUF3951 domain-containing protein [Metabacillus sp. CT-WN-B3]
MSPSDFVNLAVISFPIIIIILVFIGLYKIIVKKQTVTTYYTPFDEITGQAPVAFHEEKYMQEDEDGQGDDKNKNKNPKI